MSACYAYAFTMDSHIPSQSEGHELGHYDLSGAMSQDKAFAREMIDTGTPPDVLLRIGRTPVLKRNFGFLSIFGFSCTLLISWVAVLTGFDISIPNGGPAGFFYGLIFAFVGYLATYASLGELTSMFVSFREPTISTLTQMAGLQLLEDNTTGFQCLRRQARINF